MLQARPLPLYAKACLVLLLVYLLLYGIYLGQHIFLPLGFSFILAVLLRPIEKLFYRWGCTKVVSIVLALLIATVVLWLLVNFISNQVSSMASDVPAIKKSLESLWHQAQTWLKVNLNINYSRQNQMLENAKEETLGSFSTGVGVITTSVTTLMIIPVYIFLFLYYRPILLEFIVSVFEERYSDNVRKTVREMKSVIQYFMIGILSETTVVAILNVIGLLLLGAPYAILLGVVGAIINMIPYIGGLIQLIFSALVIYANTNSFPKMIGALVVLLVVQFIDNHFLVPNIIGSRVKLNALFSLLGVLVGGALCGIGGMFLSLPFLAICKVIFDNVDELHPWGKLLGGFEKKPRLPKLLMKKNRVAGN